MVSPSLYVREDFASIQQNIHSHYQSAIINQTLHLEIKVHITQLVITR